MRRLTKISTLLLLAILTIACHKDKELEGKLVLDHETMQMTVGDVAILKAYYEGEEVNAGQVMWESSNQNVATVSVGIVQAISAGDATITVEYQGVKTKCTVSVAAVPEEPKEDLSASVRYLQKSKKRGVGFSFSQFPKEDVATLSPIISWCYNWGSKPSSTTISDLLDDAGLEYIPMAWNGVNEQQIRSYKESHPACQYILAFNEPNLKDQANMTPQQAAEKWPALKSLADELGLKIVSPAMNYGTLDGYSDPVKWLDEFFELVPITDICAIALHCYMPSAGSMYGFIHRFDKYNLPIWMTEFCSWDKPHPGSVQAQMEYMNEAIVMLEAEPMVERYAWFIPRGSGAVDSYPYMQLLSKTDIGELSPQGQVFAAIPTFDKTTWLPSSAPILPNTYSDCSVAEAIRQGSFEAAPHLLPTTDNAGELMMTAFANNQWLEYQIDATDAINTFVIRYQAIYGSKLKITVDGDDKATLDLPWSDSAWQTAETELPLSVGHHTIRLTITGHIYFNWFKFV